MSGQRPASWEHEEKGSVNLIRYGVQSGASRTINRGSRVANGNRVRVEHPP